MSVKFKTTVTLIAVLAATRFIPHPPNATAILAMSLFGGAAIANKRSAALIVLAAMLLSDLAIGFHSTLPFVYLSLIALVFFGARYLNIESSASKIFATVGGTMFFFFVTNFGVWLVQDLYPKTAAGLVSCYIAGIPFIFNMLLSTLIYLFAAAYAVKVIEPATQRSAIRS